MNPGLVIVGHGSKNDDGVAEFTELVALVAKLTRVDVTGGFLELSSPPMTDAVAELYERGHRRLVAVPLVLVGAGHAKGDVPAALVRERSASGGADLRLRQAARAAPEPAGDPRRTHLRGRRCPASAPTPQWCWWAGALPTPTPTPMSPRRRGCCRRAAAFSLSRRRSSPWPSRASPQPLSGRGCSERVGSSSRRTSCSPACFRTASSARRELWAQAHPSSRGALRGRPGAGRTDRPAGAGALRRGAHRRRPDELRHLHLPHRHARVRGQGGRSAGAARPPRRPGAPPPSPLTL